MSVSLLACYGEVPCAGCVPAADALKAAVKKTQPECGALAKQKRVQGGVEVELKISREGEVDDVKLLTGNPLLIAQSARYSSRDGGQHGEAEAESRGERDGADALASEVTRLRDLHHRGHGEHQFHQEQERGGNPEQ